MFQSGDTGKQENPDSLCATVLGAKYIPSTDLLNAKLRKDPTSQSICNNQPDKV